MRKRIARFAYNVGLSVCLFAFLLIFVMRSYGASDPEVLRVIGPFAAVGGLAAAIYLLVRE